MKNKKGFTLVEVLIAAAIMVSVLGALAYGLGQSSNLIETTRNQDIALNAAQDMIEEIANSNLSQVINNYNGHTFDVWVDTNRNGNMENDERLLFPPAGQANPGQVTVSAVAGTNNLFDVSVTVTWQQRGGRVITRILNTTLVRK